MNIIHGMYSIDIINA